MTDELGAHRDHLVRLLVPSLSRSLAERFNVFRVMHHGTHEKQLSNVFAWLLRIEETHGLGDCFQRIFVAKVQAQLGPGVDLPSTGYRVSQEVNTSSAEEDSKDIADILLRTVEAVLVVENYESSDGHGHGYQRYLAHGRAQADTSVVVLLCQRNDPTLLVGDWADAVVLTYAELLVDLRRHVENAASWRRAHPGPYFLISQLVERFVEGIAAVDPEDQVSFIAAMCATGESARYGHQPQELAADEFANELARHARRQFEDGRRALNSAKQALRQYADRVLAPQLNATLSAGLIIAVHVPFRGPWQWCVALDRAGAASLFLEFGPTAVLENARVPRPIERPDYSQVFVTRRQEGADGIDVILETGVGLVEVLAGLPATDVRLRDALLAAATAPAQ